MGQTYNVSQISDIDIRVKQGIIYVGIQERTMMLGLRLERQKSLSRQHFEVQIL